MTPIGKLSVATLILGSAFFTAKYVHRASPEPTHPTPRPAVSRRPLAWQARSIQETAAPALTAISPSKSRSSGTAPPPAVAQKPTVFNSQIAFAAFANSNLAAPSTSTPPSETLPTLPGPIPPVDTEVASAPLSVATPHDPVSVLRVDAATEQAHANRRWPIPLALSPQSDLSFVQRHEAVPAAATDEFIEYTVQFGDSLPLLASRFLGDREAYMSIYTANLDVLSNPADVAPGLVLKIPSRR